MTPSRRPETRACRAVRRKPIIRIHVYEDTGLHGPAQLIGPGNIGYIITLTYPDEEMIVKNTKTRSARVIDWELGLKTGFVDLAVLLSSLRKLQLWTAVSW